MKGTSLDVLVFKFENSLLHRNYVEPTSSRSLLHAYSFHPHHTLKASFTSSFLRYFRLSIRELDARAESLILIKIHLEKGYSEKQLEDWWKEAL